MNPDEKKAAGPDQNEASQQAEATKDDQEVVYLSDEEWNDMIQFLSASKVEEFKLIGYEHVTVDEIWECISDKYKKPGIPPLHQVVNDILSLKATQFMNWLTINAYKQPYF